MEKPGALACVGLILAVCTLAWATLVLFTAHEEWTSDPIMMGLSGGVCMVALGIVIIGGIKVLGFAQGMTFGKLLVTGFFLFTCWSATIDTFLSLSIINYTQLGQFYVVTGEEYFKTAWGFGALLWDGTGHLLLQAIVAYKLMRGSNDFGPVLMIWCGSIINSLPVLLIGAATGKFSEDIKPSTGFNVPYVFVPVMIGFYCFSVHGAQQQQQKQRKKQALVKVSGILEILFLSFHVFSFVVHVLRTLVVLGSLAPVAKTWAAMEPVLLEETGFARIQCLQNMFLLWFWHSVMIFESGYRILYQETSVIFGHNPSNAHLWVCTFAGVALQSQVCLLCMVFFKWDNYQLQPIPYTETSMGINVALLLIPLLQGFAYSPSDKTTKQKLV